jgi:hypothetical protein
MLYGKNTAATPVKSNWNITKRRWFTQMVMLPSFPPPFVEPFLDKAVVVFHLNRIGNIFIRVVARYN